MQTNEPVFPIDEHFKIMADTAPVFIWIAGVNKLHYFFNACWLKYTGRTLEQEYGHGWRENIHPDDLQHYLNKFAAAFDTRSEFKIEYRLRRHDGLYLSILDHGVPWYVKDGSFAGYIGSCIRIDELLESERMKNEFIHKEALIKEQELNEELATVNEELAASNEELAATNEELMQAQDSLASLNNQLEEIVTQRTKALAASEAAAQALNEELMATNEELTATNEELVKTNELLSKSEESLQRTVEELILSKRQIEQSEKLFKSIAVNIPRSLIMVLGIDGRLVTIEGDLKAKLGYHSANYAGKPVNEVMPPDSYEAEKPLFTRMLSGKQFSIERKSAGGDDLFVNYVPLKTENNNVYAGLIISLDVTEIKKAEERSAKLAAIVESSDDAIISKTLDGIITSWNQGAERLFGYTPDEIIGQPVLKLIPQDRQDEEPRILDRLRRGERVKHFETRRITKDGRLLDISLTISPVKDPQGKIIGASKIARDISEKKKEELRKNDFIGMVSHELKTPITSLQAILQVSLSRPRNNPDTFLVGAMDKAILQVKKMTNMINGFLNVSHLESGRILMEKQEFDLNGLIREMVEEAELTLIGHPIQFIPNDAVKVIADRDKIASVISNLLSNAVKYSPPDSAIIVSCHALGDKAQVSVQDKGIGIGGEDHEKIFHRYYRVENKDTRYISGFGIGLYLSAEIIHRHNGEIWVESEIGKGATFYFTLPLM